MLLSVFERANLINILPREGNFKTLKILRHLRESLSLSEEEIAKWQPQISDDGVMRWRVKDEYGNDIPQESEVEISEVGHEIIAEILIKLDREKKLREEHYSLYEKFVLNR